MDSDRLKSQRNNETKGRTVYTFGYSNPPVSPGYKRMFIGKTLITPMESFFYVGFGPNQGWKLAAKGSSGDSYEWLCGTSSGMRFAHHRTSGNVGTDLYLVKYKTGLSIVGPENIEDYIN